MTNDDLVKKLREIKVIPLITLDDENDIVEIANALTHGGIPIVEITYRSPIASKAIKRLREADPDLLIAAGMVTNTIQVQEAKAAGADFIVSSGLNPNTVKACQDAEIFIVPGVNTPTAIETAMELGLTTLNFFPAEASGGVDMLKAILESYAHLNLIPTEGITETNIRRYLEIPNVVACGISWIVDKILIKQKNWEQIESRARHLINTIHHRRFLVNKIRP